MTQRRIYQNEFPYFVTFNVKDGLPLFKETKYAELLSKIIFNAGKLKGFDILSYQIMPEHGHLLTQARAAIAGTETRDMPRAQLSAVAIGSSDVPTIEGKYNISQFMYTIKSFFMKELRDKYNIPYPIFQKRFYTRVINNQKYLETIIEYIKQNPIKQNLRAKFHKLPYQFIDWEKIKSLF